ncbi:MAG: calcium-binding protein [Myxococcales bacterium]|nr:calcium-binding protein [Myxococcales bacterium]
MKINSIKTKAIDTSGLEQMGGTSSSGSASASGVEGEILARLEQMDAFEKEYGEYLSDEKRALFEELKLTLNATLTAIRTNGLGGAGGTAGTGEDSIWDWPQGLNVGWNGIPEDSIKQDANDAAKVASTAEGGEYMGTIIPPNSGNPLKPTVYGFQMGEDMSEVYLTSSGKDLILTVIYENGDKKSWLIKDGSVRKEPLVISALGLKGPVVIDCKKAYLAEGQLYLHGSEGDDIIFGAQSSTKIVGWGGNDTITGGANNDQIWGDEHYELAGSYSKRYGGEDTINGGAGYDTIYGGGKSDTVFSTDKGEGVTEHEITVENASAGAPSNTSWIESEQWINQGTTGDGTIIYTNEGNGEGGTIDLDMPPGYTMAFGDIDSDGKSLVITFVNEAGESFKVKFENFFSGSFHGENPEDAIVRLNFRGSDGNDIISFDRIPAAIVKTQIINIEGGNGDDIILGVKNQLWAQGVDVNNLEESNRTSAGEINVYVNGHEGGVFSGNNGDDPTTYGGYKAEGKGDHVFISAVDGEEQSGTITINPPEGFEYGYQGKDGNGNTVIILVDPQESGPAKTLVIKIDHRIDGAQVLVKSSVSTTEDGITETTEGNIWNLTEISLRPEDYVIDSGNGNDLVVAPTYGSRTNSNNSNETILIGEDEGENEE